MAVSPARYVVERGDWKSAAELQVRPSKFAYADAMTHFARALGAARVGNPGEAQADIAKLAELREKLRAANDAYWTEQVDIQWQVATAWRLHAEGKSDEALKAMGAAADAEDKTEKHPVTPGVPTPARELYGAMLLERGQAREALAAFEATLRTETQWPFPMDQWGRGKAFRRKPADCGTEVNIYLRAKLGSCNCMTGVADDAEIDRMSDRTCRR